MQQMQVLESEHLKQEENHSDINTISVTKNHEDTQNLYEIESEGLVEIKPSDNVDERLISAAHNGDLENVKKALFDGANINATSRNGHAGQSAIQCASLWGRYEVVKYLVGQGADIFAKKDHALRLAKHFNNEKIIKFLVDLGSDPKSI